MSTHIKFSCKKNNPKTKKREEENKRYTSMGGEEIAVLTGPFEVLAIYFNWKFSVRCTQAERKKMGGGG